jgi:hypothetical protein
MAFSCSFAFRGDTVRAIDFRVQVCVHASLELGSLSGLDPKQGGGYGTDRHCDQSAQAKRQALHR